MTTSISIILRALGLFIIAGLAEIGGGYLIWQWLRESKGIWLGVVGGAILFLYGVIPTMQSEPSFGRVYAAYGGIFIVLSILWGIVFDHWQPLQNSKSNTLICRVSTLLVVLVTDSVSLFCFCRSYFGNVRLDRRSKLDNCSELWH